MSAILAALSILVLLAAFFTLMADPATVGEAATVFTVSITFLLCLIGLGAVFGKTLGDFLRNVHG